MWSGDFTINPGDGILLTSAQNFPWSPATI